MPKCKVCSEKFTVTYFNQKCCGNPNCRENFALQTIEKNRSAKARKEKQDWKVEKKRLKEKNKTHIGEKNIIPRTMVISPTAKLRKLYGEQEE